ncbi:hypothetical protein CONLIGDRAFT_649433 [Coniochaeta ligniaria NRRL 30616]|uniref:Uncharacterized protein n=1 Tax=Coniochaeta ligniaria NRRL 30616 TaxID=1408157 RepID=A0A1J7J2L9_9PEZI|nr:hypothetical protein CONLIGDRAFT_649433 [Coniochaeta ligniaria NRRL 30616]
MRLVHLILVALAVWLGVEAGATAEIGDSVRADVATTVTLINQSGYNATSILLSFYPPAWDGKSNFGRMGNQCLLLKEMVIKPQANNTLNVTIPAFVAPAGALCALEFTLYNAPADPRKGIVGTMAYSNEFALVDGTGSWSQNELIPDGDLMMSPESLLCEAVDCVRRCQDVAFPYQCKRNDLNSRYNSTAEDASYECVRRCPGIRWPPIAVVNSALAVEALTGGKGTPTRSTCAPTTWSASLYHGAEKDIPSSAVVTVPAQKPTDGTATPTPKLSKESNWMAKAGSVLFLAVLGLVALWRFVF